MTEEQRPSSGSWRRRPLPPNWEELRKACFERDGGLCQWVLTTAERQSYRGYRGNLLCGMPGNQCDHINPDGPDELWNLQTLCAPHHKVKSSAEGGLAAGAVRKRIAAAKVRPSKPHPGLRNPNGGSRERDTFN